MGGRRAGSLKNIVGSGKKVTAARREVASAIAGADPAAIAGASANLVAASNSGLDAFRLGLRLAPVLQKDAARLTALKPSEQPEAVRQHWATLKQTLNEESTPELDSAVVSAALSTLRRKR
jgi:hypothetical protein